MPWWVMTIVWGVLVLGMLAMLAVLGWRLLRKGMTVLDELSALSEKLELLSVDADDDLPPRRNAILDGYAVAAAHNEDRQEARSAKKESRRQARIARGKILVSQPVSKGKFDG